MEQQFEYHEVSEVVVDAKVVLQIIKHGADDKRSSPNCLDGYLTGFSKGSVTEVTHSFRSMNAERFGQNDDEFNRISAQYQENMLRRLRDQNQDHLLVGHYRKVPNFAFMTKPEELLNFIEFQMGNDQVSSTGTIMLVYDEKRMSHGDFGLRAYRVSRKAMELYWDCTRDKVKKSKAPFVVSNVQDHNLTVGEMLIELPISVKSSWLMNCLLHQIESFRLDDIDRENSGSLFGRASTAKHESRLTAPAYTVASARVLQEQAEHMKNCVEDVHQHSNRFVQLQRNLHNATIKKHQIISTKERENAEREQNGEKVQAIDIAEIDKQVKMPEEHNRIGGMVSTIQANLFCESVKNISSGTMGKLFLAESVTDK